MASASPAAGRIHHRGGLGPGRHDSERRPLRCREVHRFAPR